MDDAAYVVDLPNGSLAMNIIELDENDTVVKSSNYQSGQQWRKDANTYYIGISIYSTSSDTTYGSILKQMEAYGKTGLSLYTQYVHNTNMNALTASDFVNNINVGWNLGNSLDSKASVAGLDANLKQETNWGNPYISKSLIDYVSSCGFNTIRIPVTWYYNTYEEEGHLKISQNWLKRVQDVVDYAIDNDMYVIINSHHDQPIFYAGVDDAAFSKVLEDADDVWTQIAEYFKTYDEHLIFESFNEIDNLERSWNFGENAAVQMNELNQVFVNAVRKTGGNNAERILVVPTLLDGMKYQFLNAFELPTDTVSDRMVVEVHTYLKKFGQDIESDFSLLKDFSDKIGTPVIIGEFGTNNSYPIPGLREEHAANFVARAVKYGIKCIWWDNGSDYGIVDRNNYDNSNNDIINALMNGSKGIAYSMPNETLLTSFDQYVSGTLNRENGEIAASPYWGTLVTDIDGKGIPVKSGDTCAVSLNVSGEAADVWLQYLAFYDSDGNVVGQVQDDGSTTFVKGLLSVYYTCTVPDNASYVRISMNSPYTNIKMNQYETFMNNGNIQLGIYFFNEENIVQEKLIVE